MHEVVVIEDGPAAGTETKGRLQYPHAAPAVGNMLRSYALEWERTPGINSYV